MRIVQFIDTLRSGGKERQLVELLKGLTKTPGIECELIVMSDSIHYAYLNELGVPIHSLLRRTKKDLTVFKRLYRLLKQIKPDILHSWSSMCSVYALPAIKLLNIKFINGFLRDAPPSLSISDKEWLRSKLTFPFSDAIVANSKAGLRAYDAPKKKSHYIYNGFDFNRITNLFAPETVKKKYRLTTKFIVGMVASFSDYKDYYTFADAALIIVSKRNDVTFLAIGDGINLESCKKKVPDKFREFIKFPGKITDVEPLVQIMTIGVLLSPRGEGISNSIMEYMALGKPVVATDCGGNRELILDGETGYLVQNGAADELAKRILLFLDNSILAHQFGETGKQRMHDIFNLEKLTQKHVSLYKQLLG
jgi:glycosyltransferase involved in cell wall biosynthesis